MPTSRSLLGDVIIPLLLAVVGGSILVASYHFGWGDFREPEPGMYPGFVGGLMLICAVISVFDKSGGEHIRFDRQGLIRVFIVIGALILWCVSIFFLGNIIVTFLASAVISRTMFLKKSWIIPLVIASILTIATYLLFDLWFYLDLPRGIWG
jgi:hypothetical protein